MPKGIAVDAIDLFMVEWSRQQPELDFTYLATMGRILRISAHLREEMDRWLAPFGLNWELFDLLVTLLRSGGAEGLRPTDLYAACMLSSGATTNRIDRGEKLGYVERRPDRDDGRATRIALTKEGRRLAQRAMKHHTVRASAIAGALSAQERKELAPLLSKLLRSFGSNGLQQGRAGRSAKGH